MKEINRADELHSDGELIFLVSLIDNPPELYKYFRATRQALNHERDILSPCLTANPACSTLQGQVCVQSWAPWVLCMNLQQSRRVGPVPWPSGSPLYTPKVSTPAPCWALPTAHQGHTTSGVIRLQCDRAGDEACPGPFAQGIPRPGPQRVV